MSKKKVRAGHRGFLTGILPEIDAGLENVETGKAKLLTWKATIKEQLEKILPLDEAILAELVAKEESTEDEVAEEISRAASLKAETTQRLVTIDEKLTALNVLPSAMISAPASNPLNSNLTENAASPGTSANSKTARVKLPKLEVRKFVGKLEEWQEFWDSFENAIHLNDSLSKVDKFSYLRGLLVGPARSAIAGFTLTSANYESAVELLKNRYGKKTAIQRAHGNELLNVQPVYNERDAQRLRSLYDFLETKHRALQALEVDESTYSAIVVPSVLEKLPHALRLTITRGKEHQLWNLSDLLKALGGEIELREDYNDNTRHRDFRKRSDVPPSTTMYVEAGKETNCAFYLESHLHEDCHRIKDVEERKKLLSKFGRCFNCLRKGHLAKNCSNRKKVICKYCKGKHHSALCVESQGNVETQENQRVPVNIESVGMTTTGNSMHVSTGNSVALQTAQAQIAGKGTSRVRVLFDTASHKSFVTSRVVKSFELETLRREWLTVNTFGQRATGSNFRDVVGIDLTPVGGGKVMRIEAFVVPEISRVRNEHLEIARRNYPHLAQIWLSDVCKGSKQLEIDLLIGADYLWSFQTGSVVRGKVNEPVAVQTELGWVISGPLSYEQPAYRAQEVQVNFVGSDSIMTESLERNVQRLWDLEALGIAGSSEVYEDFVDSIAFNGTRVFSEATLEGRS